MSSEPTGFKELVSEVLQSINSVEQTLLGKLATLETKIDDNDKLLQSLLDKIEVVEETFEEVVVDTTTVGQISQPNPPI